MFAFCHCTGSGALPAGATAAEGVGCCSYLLAEGSASRTFEEIPDSLLAELVAANDLSIPKPKDEKEQSRSWLGRRKTADNDDERTAMLRALLMWGAEHEDAVMPVAQKLRWNDYRSVKEPSLLTPPQLLERTAVERCGFIFFMCAPPT